MSTELMVTSEITSGLPIISTSTSTLTSTNSSQPKEESEDENYLTIYISVPIVIIILILLAVIVVILIRRHKIHEKENAESEAVYSGDDMPRRKRSIPGIQNQAYCTYSIESKDNNKSKNDSKNHSNGIYRKTSHDSITDLPKVVSYQNINMQSSNDLSKVYINNRDLTDDPNNSSYTYVANVHGGFEVKSDVYSDVTFEDQNYYNDAYEIATGKLTTPNIGNRNKNHTGKVEKSSAANVGSVYDHAVAGKADPVVERSDESLHLSEAKDIEERKNPTRHSYVNVPNQNNHVANIHGETRNTYDHIELADFQSQQHEDDDEYSHLNEKGGTGTPSFPHKYENVIQGDDSDCLNPPPHRKQNGGYEEPVGNTPNYFVIGQ